MKVLFYQWNAFMQKGMENALNRLGIDYDIFFYQFVDGSKWEDDDAFVEKLSVKLGDYNYDTVLSVNFVPLIATTCEKYGIHYVSWIYDCPLHIQSFETMKLSCNDIYFFDVQQAKYFKELGVSGTHTLPLAVDSQMFGGEVFVNEHYNCDVSLVGQLYRSDYNKVCSSLDQYTRGYLEGCLGAQQNVVGGYILPELVTNELIEELNNQSVCVNKRQLEYLLACEVTGRDRRMALSLLQSRYKVCLYSNDSCNELENVDNKGYIDYYNGMPQVFRSSKVNLNISLRAIQTGIPLRVLDIIGSGGFLITNYQEELLEYFSPGEDIVIYETMKDLILKTDYYLHHDEERKNIIRNGLKKVKEAFNFDDRIKRMLIG